ncbi:hypothetical protein HRbin22_01065 [Candidatus Thermoflexus japonica]|uniref:Uncharacterized protein n=1 Tax=Candidatus Thermoflexus japonica TaxID=2035417 RepID=A0A2H5Y5V1_9CHLR|nr:hypothetical protein HRbin22_01065 [Candidatus Thermoflexus japonica]
MEFLNRHSFLVFGGLVLLGLGAFLWLRRAGWIGWGLWALILMAMVGFWLSRRTSPTQPFASQAEIEAALRSGRPVLVYWFSNY